MGRNIRHALPANAPVKPADATVEPHRYLYSGADDAFRWNWRELDYKKWKAKVPYQEGQVIYIDRNYQAVKALILDVGSRIPEHGPDAGDKVETYRVAYETASGEWSRNWLRIHPGDVQRGYQRAGLAPDVDRWHPLPKPKS